MPILKMIQMLAGAACLVAATTATAASNPPLVISYFVPRDREPIAGYVDRLDRVMTEVQRFYAEGMQAAGYGPLSFTLERDAEGRLVVHRVEGKLPLRDYGRDDSGKVRDEVAAALQARGVSLHHRTLVIFQVLLEWRNGTALEVGPYVGGGDHLGGTAWVYDDALLDPRRLSSRDPGGYYGKPCSVGEFNSHYIGGVAHELGHALGLPHVAGPKSERRHSLMGDGNHTYGEDLRGEGSGTYLHPASAMLLARCRPFAGVLEDSDRAPDCELQDLDARFDLGQLQLRGRLEASPPAFGVVAYNDPTAIPGDYEATGWTAAVDSNGQFNLVIGGLDPGSYELRLQVCHTNGASTRFAFLYHVNSQGTPDLSPFSPVRLILTQAGKAFAQGKRRQTLELLNRIEKEASVLPDLSRKARHLRSLLEPRTLIHPAAVPPSQKEVAVSDLEFSAASVGWGRPLRDQVWVEGGNPCFLEVGGRFFERGLYAHAPSSYGVAVGQKWKRLAAQYGLQDGHAGSVIFVVRGDGRELFRSERITNHNVQRLELDIGKVANLELAVEDAGDSSHSDWGVWLDPTLER
jgi:hypothetical protein